ncbi:3-deoxy-7-phosphoheptulonate synthase [Mycoplasmatota bacterium]|nr:3-deoxy-7-phosphoheptulonate synthase [Mycoplasmatota bacterium]
MIIKVRGRSKESEINRLKKHLNDSGFELHVSQGINHLIIGVIGDTVAYDTRGLYGFECVESVIRIQEPYRQANIKFKTSKTIVDVGGVRVGGDKIILIAGPCSVESMDSFMKIAEEVNKLGADCMRGGAYKPRTSPYAFQGLELEGLKIMDKAKGKYNMPIVSEIMSMDKIDEFEKYVDLVQVGARNMQNFELLKALGKISKPILLKRGFSNTVQEWIMSAEYILASGNPNVILCERGIRTFENYTRNTLDVSAILAAKRLTHLPIIVDPSHAAGRWELVEDLSKAAIAAGADGLIIEVHTNPEEAMSDGAQSLKPSKFKELIKSCRKIASAVERDL